jgi:cell surface protein SprA
MYERGNMKKFFLLLLGISVLFTGCNKDECDPISPPIDSRESFEWNYTQYYDNSYFIDSIYADTSSSLNIYNLYYGSIPPVIKFKYFVKSIEVYESVNTIYDIEQSIIANAYINLQSRSRDSMYSDELRNNNTGIAGEIELARFVLLDEGSDYTFNPATGQINILKLVDDNDIIAAAYALENESPEYSDDLYFGEFFGELINHSKTKGVLKLIKPANLNPNFTSAWKNKLKNVYPVLQNTGAIYNLDFDIYLKKSDGTELNKIDNVSLLQLFGFDKFNEKGEPVPDGKFDGRVGIDYDSRTSLIFFPLLQPFGMNIPGKLSNYIYQDLYDSLKDYHSLPGDYFIFRGKFNRP